MISYENLKIARGDSPVSFYLALHGHFIATCFLLCVVTCVVLSLPPSKRSPMLELPFDVHALFM